MEIVLVHSSFCKYNNLVNLNAKLFNVNIKSIKGIPFIEIDKTIGDCSWKEANSESDGDRISNVPWPTKNIESVDDCARLCEKTQGCNGFHYYGIGDLNNGECYMKQRVTKLTERVADGRTRYGGICSKYF